MVEKYKQYKLKEWFDGIRCPFLDRETLTLGYSLYENDYEFY